MLQVTNTAIIFRNTYASNTLHVEAIPHYHLPSFRRGWVKWAAKEEKRSHVSPETILMVEKVQNPRLQGGYILLQISIHMSEWESQNPVNEKQSTYPLNWWFWQKKRQKQNVLFAPL